MNQQLGSLGDANTLDGAYAGIDDETAHLAAVRCRRFIKDEDALAFVLAALGIDGAA